MGGWTVLYYEDHDGNCSIERFIEERDQRNQAKILALLSMLEEKGPLLPRPYADILENGIHELRIKLSGDQVRVLYYFVYQEYIVLSHAFVKKSKQGSKIRN